MLSTPRGRPNKTEAVYFRLLKSTYKTLRAAARKQGMTLAAYLRRNIEMTLGDWK